MKAMIFAAGLGTRLKPLTDSRPKALVELSGRTLLAIAIERLKSFGVTELIVNVHHFAEMIADYLRTRNHFGVRIELSREEMLLDTGGGLKKAAWFFLEDSRRLDEPFLVHNVDVLSSIDFRGMLEFHREKRALATLAVQKRESTRNLLFTEQLQLCGRSAVPGGPTDSLPARFPFSLPDGAVSAPGSPGPLLPLAFCGLHVISPRLFSMISEEGSFSIIETYLRLSAEKQKILAFRADQSYWRDLGRPSDLSQAALEGNAAPAPG